MCKIEDNQFKRVTQKDPSGQGVDEYELLTESSIRQYSELPIVNT